VLLRRTLAGTFTILSLGVVPSAADANVVGDVLGFPFRWIGGNLVAGGADKLKGTVEDLDTRLKGHETRISELVTDVKGKVDDTIGKVDNTVDTVNRSLEARLLQFKTGNDDTVQQAMSQVDSVLRERLLQAKDVGTTLIDALDDKVQHALSTADGILRDRTADIDRKATVLVAQADQAVKDRIAQVDEAVGRRLGNVDVIASKQRIAFERAAIRVAVIIGAVVFLVFVLREIWDKYTKLSTEDLTRVRGHKRAGLYARRLLPALLKPLAAAALAGAVLFGLYSWLPMSAQQEAEDLTALHTRELDAATLRVDYPRARFHASHLEFLNPVGAAATDAKANKTALIRDLIARPALLGTAEGVTTFAERLSAIERGLGSRPDPDVLVLHAVLKWTTGATRREEHQAASLSARALRLSPRGFAMAPLARAYVQTFLDAPHFAEKVEVGRESETADGLAEALAGSAPDSPNSPFAPMVELARLMRELDKTSTRKFVEMIEAHAERNLKTRTKRAEEIVADWVNFDKALATTEGQAGSIVLNVFRLNDAILTHARWFLAYPETTEEPRRLESLSGKTQADLELKLKLLPARIAWARRYERLFQSTARVIAEFEEAERFRIWERWTIEFEKAMVAYKRAEATAEQEPEARWRVVIAASALSLYVDTASGRVAYAEKRAEGMQEAPSASLTLVSTRDAKARGKRSKAEEWAAPAIVRDAPTTLEAALLTRGPRTL
jgi:hypothetical protein